MTEFSSLLGTIILVYNLSLSIEDKPPNYSIYIRIDKMGMLTDTNYEDLKAKGYTIVPGVLTSSECDDAIAQYQKWIADFKDKDEWPNSFNSLILSYNVGHMAPTWSIRLKTKHVFEQVWKTDKLLTSFDAIAIGRPPEDGHESFYAPGQSWLHLDQSPARDGLHAYQGAVYLEESAEDDWTMEVFEGSHNHFKEFFNKNPSAQVASEEESYYELKTNEVKQFEDNNCVVKRVPCPKGGMILWDSRLVHANARPLKGRKNSGRWRFCVFVSMTPAIWANEKELQTKREAYESAIMTTHWSSQGVGFFQSNIPESMIEKYNCPTTVPECAQTKEAKQLAGVVPYDFDDGKPTGIEILPKWTKEEYRGKRYDQCTAPLYGD